MRKNVRYLWVLLLLGVAISGCDKNGELPDKSIDALSLEEAVERAAVNIDKAVEAIELSPGYHFWLQDASVKSSVVDDAPALSIYLDDIKGIYEYTQVAESEGSQLKNGSCHPYFMRTGDSEWFITLLPFELVKHPRKLFSDACDEEFINNLKITATDFLYEADNTAKWHSYRLASRFDVDDVYAGDLRVEEERKAMFNTRSMSKFGFTDEYFLEVMTQFNDTIMLSYCLEDADEEPLYCEKVSFILEGVPEEPNLQFAYEMQIGDVKIVKTLDEEYQLEYEIYKGDVLQENATVEVITPEGEAPTSVNCLFMHKRKDMRITFDDESSVLLSELIGDSQDILAELFSSMKELYLSKMVINRLAWQIYSEQLGEGEEN